MDNKDWELIQCDFCNEERAILFCRADSAKLCLSCDLHVHSANDLSKKHVRSQICNNCNCQPVSISCSTHKLLLCQECDWDAHANCSDRNPVEGFTGCPSALDLALRWGIDLCVKNNISPLSAAPIPLPQNNTSVFSNWSSLDSILSVDSWINNSAENSLMDVVVPMGVSDSTSLLYPNVSSTHIPTAPEKDNSSCGKHKHLILKQLLQLLNRDPSEGDKGGHGEDLTPTGSATQGSAESLNLQDGVYDDMDANQLMHQQVPYTALLMSNVNTHLKPNLCLPDEDGLWGSNPPPNESSQIWDFNLGRSRDYAVPSQHEDGYGRSDAGFVIQCYNDFIKRSPPDRTEVLENIYGITCSTTQDRKNSAKAGGYPLNFSMQSNSKKSTSSQRPKKSESRNLVLTEACSSKDINCVEQPLLLKGESATTPSKVDMELFAQNRGNAMLRYKEKKRTRRFDKHIRYESRKARADTRKRVKGRFVKASEIPDADMSS